MKKSIVSKKHGATLLVLFLFFFLSGDFLLSYVQNDFVAVGVYFIVEFVYFVIVLLFLLVKNYSYLKNWQYLLLAITNLIYPTYWFIVYYIYNCYAPSLLKYSIWFDDVSFVMCILLCLYSVVKLRNTRDGTLYSVDE